MVKSGWKLLLILLLVGFLIGTSGAAQAARNDVVIAEQTWVGNIVMSQIMKHVLETRLNIPVTIKSIGQAIAWPAIEKGEVDVIADMWLPNQAPAINLYVKEKKVAELSVTYSNASQGIYVPTWVAKQYNIRTIDDLNKHTKMFDLNGDSKGDIWCGASSWMVANEMKIKIRDYKLDYDPLVLEQWAFLAILKEKMRKKEPILFYYWSPEWVFAVYDFTKIEEPPYDPAKWKFVENKPEESKITCDWQPGTAHTAFAVALKTRLPKAYKFLQQWYIPIEQMNVLIREASDIPDSPKKDPQAVAVKWVKDNPKIVNDWLKDIK